jgi:hypothetical protein
MPFENAIGKNVKTCVLTMWKNVKKCKNMWNMWKNGNKMQLKSSCSLAPFFHFFPDIGVFQVFFETQC